MIPENKSVDFETLKKQLKEELKDELRAEIAKELKREEKQTKELKIPTTIDHTPKKSPVVAEPLKTKEEYLVTLSTLLKMATHALKYANKKIPRGEWVEVFGLLSGVQEDNGRILHIMDAYPMGHGDAIYVDIKDYSNFAKVYHEITKNGQFIVGSYHSHPSYGLFISEEDFGNLSRYQRLWDKAVTLVIDPFLINGKSIGFKVFRANLQTGQWYSLSAKLDQPIDPSVLPSLLEFMTPVVEGKPVYLEYDESG
ncbi:MAG: 26S proteasome regulatory subunit N11-like protein [Promethearchaeota archaeon CR_4]|nr:MAG: 26S proteasome regulatory subunit N11-like protein [Candidatus Lokiarchaeota archaeon CR_4]